MATLAILRCVASARLQWLCEAILADASGRVYCSIGTRRPLRVLR